MANNLPDGSLGEQGTAYYGVLSAPEVNIILPEDSRRKATIVDKLAERYKTETNQLRRLEADRIRTAVTFQKDGAEKRVLIRLSDSGYEGYDINLSWEGDVIFLRNDPNGANDIPVAGTFSAALCGKETYEKVKKSLKGQSRAAIFRNRLNDYLDQENLNLADYFGA